MSRSGLRLLARFLGKGLSGLLLVLYPFVVYFVLERWGPRAVAGVLLVGVVPGLVIRSLRSGVWNALTGAGAVSGVILVLAGASLALREVGLALLAPVAVNASLAGVFGATLSTEHPLVERFARLQHPDLTPDEVAWCRRWTQIWTAYFVLNVGLVSALAFVAPVRWWVIYTGGVAYAVMGGLFTVEYVLRKRRFGRWDGHLLDRGLAWILGRGDRR